MCFAEGFFKRTPFSSLEHAALDSLQQRDSWDRGSSLRFRSEDALAGEEVIYPCIHITCTAAQLTSLLANLHFMCVNRMSLEEARRRGDLALKRRPDPGWLEIQSGPRCFTVAFSGFLYNLPHSPLVHARFV